MPGQVDLVRIILPALIRLCPELIEGTVTRGKIVALKDVDPMNEAEALRKLARKLRVRQRENFRDSAHVIKVSDAIKCLETVNDKNKTFFLQFAKWAAKNLIGTGGGDLDRGPMQTYLDECAECFRDKCLKQTAPRSRVTYRYSKRAI